MIRRKLVKQNRDLGVKTCFFDRAVALRRQKLAQNNAENFSEFNEIPRGRLVDFLFPKIHRALRNAYLFCEPRLRISPFRS